MRIFLTPIAPLPTNRELPKRLLLVITVLGYVAHIGRPLDIWDSVGGVGQSLSHVFLIHKAAHLSLVFLRTVSRIPDGIFRGLTVCICFD